VRGRDHLGGILERRRERVERRALGRDGLLEHRLDDRFLALEVVVEGPEADVGLVGYLLDPRVVDALTGEEHLRGVEELGASHLAAARLPIRLHFCDGINSGGHVRADVLITRSGFIAHGGRPGAGFAIGKPARMNFSGGRAPHWLTAPMPGPQSRGS
jgi:hypothetical protein